MSEHQEMNTALDLSIPYNEIIRVAQLVGLDLCAGFDGHEGIDA